MLLNINLGRAALEVPGGKKVHIKCHLAWVEPFIWTLQQLRWTKLQDASSSAVEKRQTSCSWLELALICSIATGRAVGPRNVSYLASAAICKQLWNRAARFVQAVDDTGQNATLQKFGPLLKCAGAAVTCGIANLTGLARRPITDDIPGMSLALAALLKYAADSPERLFTSVPALSIPSMKWEPSGLISTAEMLCAQPVQAAPSVDFLQAKVKASSAAKKGKPKLSGPCVFGCNTSLDCKKAVAWYRVPRPSPWPEIMPGEVICRRCYLWGVANRRAVSKRRLVDAQRAQPKRKTPRIGDTVTISGLVNAPQLNGRSAKVLLAEDDDGRILIDVPEHPNALRLQAERLEVVQANSEGADNPPGCDAEHAGVRM